MLKLAVTIEFQECYPTMSRASMGSVEPKTAPIVAQGRRRGGRTYRECLIGNANGIFCSK